MNKALALIPFLAVLFFSCDDSGAKKKGAATSSDGNDSSIVYSNETPQEDNEATADDTTPESFHDPETGWTMSIPKGWQVIDKETVEAKNKRNEELVGLEEGTFSTEGQVLCLLKNNSNRMAVASEPYDKVRMGTQEEMVADHKNTLFQVYQPLSPDSSFTKKERVDGLEFYVYEFRMQIMGDMLKNRVYTRIIKGQVFLVAMFFDNNRDKETLWNAWMNSTFAR